MFTSTPGEFYDWVILGNTLLLDSIYFVGWSSVLAGSLGVQSVMHSESLNHSNVKSMGIIIPLILSKEVISMCSSPKCPRTGFQSTWNLVDELGLIKTGKMAFLNSLPLHLPKCLSEY